MKIYATICLTILFAACQNPDKKAALVPAATLTKVSEDTRPKDEVQFLNKVKNNSGYDMPTSAIAKDQAIESFNKYASDSLKNIQNWEFKVTGITDDSNGANSVFNTLGNGDQPIYNLNLVASAIVDRSVDTISTADRVDFIYTTPKVPKTENLKKILATMKTLSNGDVVLVSGAITHVNDKGKIDFSPFFEDSLDGWKLDVLITDIHKKTEK